MKEKKKRIISVIIPRHEDRYLVAKKSKKTGKPKYWIVNGQGLYNATLHYRQRGLITKYFHAYLSEYIKKMCPEDIKAIHDTVTKESSIKISTSVDIYEIRRGRIPDVGNMWLWIKWFEDALQECGVIEDDNPDYVIESGRKRYHWVDNEEDRKLIFHINFIQTEKQK